ncbi:MAG: bifunctional ADP-heptose synthase [Bacteroidota bacterium]
MTIEEIFKGFKRLRVLVIGDVMVDAYIWGGVERVSPEAPVPVVRVTKRDYRLGGAANVALNVQALGATPILCSVVGKDEAGDRFKERLAQRNLSSEGLLESEDRPTTIKTRVISGHQHVVRVDEETDKLLNDNEEKQLIKKITDLISDADVVIFEDYDKGVITEKVIQQTISKANERGIPTVVVPKKRNFLNYKEATLFKPNLKELREGLKIEINPSVKLEVEEAVIKLKETLGLGSALITLSEHGVYIDHKNSKNHIAAHLREVSDVSGAGDTVISIAGLCLALGLSAEQIARLSNLGGGLVCEHVGVVPIDLETLKREAQKLNF